MKWQIRFLKNSIIGILPLAIQGQLRTVKRKIIPHRLEIDKWALDQGLQQIEMLKNSGFDLNNKSYLELGTGWSPVIPLVFSLAGCKSITLVDSQRLMDGHTFQETCQQLMGQSKLISSKLDIDQHDVENRLFNLSNMTFKLALSEINCNYLAPYDLLKNDMLSQSVDIITSRAVLEHIPPRTVQDLFVEFSRLLREDGAMCHIIDNSDHWEHDDKSICRLNFLKYSQAAFNIISSMNPLDYQNRLRHPQYKKMITEAGFRVVYDKSFPDGKALRDLASLNIHKYFRRFSIEDLAVLTSYIVAAK